MARKTAAQRKAILEKSAEEMLVFGKRDHAVPNVARRQDAIFAAQPAGATTIVSDGDYGGKIGDRPRNCFVLARGNVLLQSTQDGGQARAATQGDDANGTSASL